MHEHRAAMIVLFGATGDLTKRKLIPALYSLYKKKEWAKCPIICIGRKKFTKTQFLKHLDFDKFLPDKKELTGFKQKILYTQIHLDKESPGVFKQKILKIDKEFKTNGNMLFYLATPAFLFEKITGLLKSISQTGGWKRVVYEKPFGRDLSSARTLNRCIQEVFKEDQIYRIDHFLGKELVQNILVSRFSNRLLNNSWNREHIDNVQIIFDETLGVEERAGYYELSGVVRDMLQNHLLQILALTTMESPTSLSVRDIDTQKIRLLRSIRPAKRSDFVFGQYKPGKISGKTVKAYRDESDILYDSQTPTFVAAKIMIDNYRWNNVPFYLRTGKRLGRNHAEVKIVFKDTACKLFCKPSEMPSPNIISFRIKPDEGLALTVNAKRPGPELEVSPVTVDYCHECEFGYNTAEAYEVLLHQAMVGDQTLFTSWKEVEASWKFIDSVLKWQGTIPNYIAGSNGPKASDELLKKLGHKWI